MRARDAASSDRFPPDVLFNVLLRLPAKDLCRLRAVCRSWRALTSGDPLFAAAHAAAHPGPLLLAKFLDDKSSIYVADLSGNVLKRVADAAGGPYQYLLCRSLNLVCLASDWKRCWVLDPATGAVRVLPESPAVEHVNLVNLRDPYTSFTFGRVAATGEHKVLRMFNRPSFGKGHQQLFEVFTISGGDARWRGRQGPGLFIDKCSGVVVDGVVYFLMSRVYDDSGSGIRPDYIVSFDLGTEEWRRDLRGPISSSNAADMMGPFYLRRDLNLAGLNGSLVLADHHDRRTMDLWFLPDFENGLWVKEYHIQTGSIIPRLAGEDRLKPLLVLDDGRLVFYLAGKGLLLVCDPTTNSFAKVNTRGLDSVGVYTGNLLS
ncbi:unnamed protein product [Urochloa decumbens]|uniref:F-box domain-containing protein n=1 Tax=Urochloa decumbens TaxID=240449 RepID=A0ABC9G9Q5_9POAL